MSIVLDEYSWAEKMIENNDLGKKPFETLTRVAGYYFKNKYSEAEVEQLLGNFLIRCDPNISVVKWADTINRAIKVASKYPVKVMECVNVTVPELKIVDSLASPPLQRLAFTLLCNSKYWNYVCDSEDGWVNTSDKEIMKMANINTSIRRQSQMFATLKENDLIAYSKRIDNLNVRVLYNIPGDTALCITDYRNLGYQYIRYRGGDCYECENCGLVLKSKPDQRGPRPKYCPQCAVEMHIKKSADSVKRQRNILKNANV